MTLSRTEPKLSVPPRVLQELGADLLEGCPELLTWILSRLGITHGFSGYRNLFAALTRIVPVATDLELPGVDWQMVQRGVTHVTAHLATHPGTYSLLATTHHQSNPLYGHFNIWPVAACLLQPIPTKRESEISRVLAVVLASALVGEGESVAEPVVRVADEVRKACSYELGTEDPWTKLPNRYTGNRYVWSVYSSCDRIQSIDESLSGWRLLLTSLRDVCAYLWAEAQQKSGSKDITLEYLHLVEDQESCATALAAEDGQLCNEDEAEPVLIYLLQEKLTPDSESISHAGFEANARLSRHWLETFSSGMPWSTHVLNPIELTFLIGRLRDNSQSSEYRIPILIMELMIATGRGIDDVMDFKLGDDGEITASGHYQKPLYRPKSSFSPGADHRDLLKSSAEILVLTLPASIKEKIASYFLARPKASNVSELLGIDSERAKECVGRFVSTLKDSGYRRITVDRIRFVLRNQLSIDCDDPVQIHLLTSSAYDAFPSASYYASIPLSKLHELYARVMKEIFGA